MSGPLFAIFFVATVGAGALGMVVWRQRTLVRREAYIRSAPLPKGVLERLRRQHPHLTPHDCELVAHGLRQFFLAYLKGGQQFVAMPSQVVDDLWHEFILCTRHYEQHCRKAFGRFLHHTPATVLGGTRRMNQGLRRCWQQACQEESIDPGAPARLPLLFALDAKLNIPGGCFYAPDCSGVRRDDGRGVYCAGSFSDPAIDRRDGPDDGRGGGGGGCGGGASSSDGDGDGCGGGCGGGD